MNSEGEIVIENGHGENFIIHAIGNNQIWIEAESGEGMSCDQKQLFDCINEFFNKEF